jgi:hypothetical protein
VSRAEELAQFGDFRLACHLVDYALEAKHDDSDIQKAVSDLYLRRAENEIGLMSENLSRSASAYAK